jgi:hypothetical protein
MVQPSTPANHDRLRALLVVPIVNDIGLLGLIGNVMPFCRHKLSDTPPQFGDFVNTPAILPSLSPLDVVGMIPTVHRMGKRPAFAPQSPQSPVKNLCHVLPL